LASPEKVLSSKKRENKHPNRNTYILTIIFLVGFAISIWYTTRIEYVPINHEAVNKSDDAIYVVVTKEKDILLPISTYFADRTSKMDVDIYFKIRNLSNANFRDIVLSENNSKLLTVKDEVNKTSSNLALFDLNLLVRHPLAVTNHTERYSLDIFYRLPNETVGDLRKLSIPLQWNIQTLDFSPINYFFIIFGGVLLSRVFSIPTVSPNPASWNTLDKREYLWVPFSAIVTLLIFTSFTQQIKLTSDILLNFALAFGFGFGFDKVFESWNKAPRETKESEQPKPKESEQPKP
jgi:hypothetical protein